jgi:isoleucyl-tRNA synthetase
LKLGQQYHLPVLHAVGEDGAFVPEVLPVAGLFCKDADPLISGILRERGLLYRAERKVIYYAKNAWYKTKLAN